MTAAITKILLSVVRYRLARCMTRTAGCNVPSVAKERDVSLADVMKNVNKVHYEVLTEEQIAAARKRRSQELCELLPALWVASPLQSAINCSQHLACAMQGQEAR